MAYEIYSDSDGMVVLGKAQAAEGTKETLSASNVLMPSAFDSDIDIEFLEREVISTHGPGVKPAVGRSVVNWSFETEIKSPTLSATPAVGDVEAHPFLHAGQWQSTVQNNSGTPDEDAIVYVLGDHAAQVSTFAHRLWNAAEDDGHSRQIVDAVCSTKLSWQAGQIFKMSGEGKARGFITDALSDVLVSATNAAANPQATAPDAVTLDSDEPLVFKDASIQIYDVAGDVLYGGGSVDAPDGNLGVLSLDFDSGLEVFEQLGAASKSGVQRLRARRTRKATMGIGLEVGDLDDFNPESLRKAVSPLVVSVRLTGSNGTHCQFLSQGIIKQAPMASAGGNRIYNLALDCIYPSDYSADSTALGLTPGQIFKQSGSSIPGLRFTPNSALTTKGIALLAFWITRT